MAKLDVAKACDVVDRLRLGQQLADTLAEQRPSEVKRILSILKWDCYSSYGLGRG